MDYSSFMPDGNGFSGSNILGGVVGVMSLGHLVMPKFIDEAFSLIPHHTVFTVVPVIPIPFFWNLLTAHFFEGHILKAVFVSPWVIALARMLERLWTPKAMTFHLAFTACLAGMGVFIYELMTVYATHSHKAFFAPVRGSVGLVVALAVGLRHAYPFEALPLVPHSWGLQCQHLPFALTAFFTAVGVLFPHDFLPEWPFAPLALFWGWLHIRYLMWFPYAEAHGDHTPEFNFETLFPKPMRPLASCCGAISYKLGMSCCSGFVKLREADETLGHAIMYDPAKAPETEARLPGPGSSAGGATQREYDARRAKALQLLDDNINALLAAGSRATSSPQKRATGENGMELAAMDEKDL